MTRNFHTTPFDDGTLTKLFLFRNYIAEWLPVFVTTARPGERITLVDFFAGPGRDVDGVAGTPLVALEEIRRWSTRIRERNSPIRLVLNDRDKNKTKELSGVMEGENVPEDLCKYEIYSDDFQEAFHQIYPSLSKGPNLIIMDQKGVSAMSDSVFNKIVLLPRTDFLFFVASSTLRRFESHANIQKYLKIPAGAVTGTTFNDTHRAVADYYRGLVGASKEIFLGNFSIKKGSNMYGVIFGSGHSLGLEKFLRVCWKIDPERGEANFDIDSDGLDAAAPHLFPEMDLPKKRTGFQRRLSSKILDGTLSTDAAVYIESIQEGFLPVDGRQVVNSLMKQGKITVNGGRPRVSQAGLKNHRTIEVT